VIIHLNFLPKPGETGAGEVLAALVADRERSLAARERELAQREKETCGGGAPMIIQQVAAPKGGNYTRKDIEPMIGRAKTAMQKKGILGSDLGPASGLEAESTKAMADGDWGKAYLAAAQLAATVDAIKIDRGFITDIATQENARNIVKTVIDLCRNLKFDCVVEGVETAEQVEIIRQLGCSTMQGYFFARPMSQDELADFIAGFRVSDHQRMEAAAG